MTTVLGEYCVRCGRKCDVTEDADGNKVWTCPTSGHGVQRMETPPPEVKPAEVEPAEVEPAGKGKPEKAKHEEAAPRKVEPPT
jgi:hypothetical protein